MARAWMYPTAALILAFPALAADRLVPSQYPTIQAAINAASAGDSVVVLPGVYTGPGNRDLNPLGRAITIRSSAGASVTVLDCEGSAGTPRRGFQVSSGTSALVIDGFTIRNGYSSDGGAIWIFGNASPVIRNVIVENNGANRGGGVYFFGAGTPSFVNCTFRRNVAAFGGGACKIGPGSAAFSDCIFEANSAGDDGAGVFLQSGPATFLRCNFTGGSAVQDGGGLCADNAGVATLTDCTLTANTAARGAGCSAYDNCSLTLVGSTLSNNSAEAGGGIQTHNAVLTLTDCAIQGNAALREGGGARCDGPSGSVSLTNARFLDNSSGGWGGGLYALSITSATGVSIDACTFSENTAVDAAGAARIGGCRSSVSHTRFSNNSAADGGGLRLDGDASATSAISFCTFENNSATANYGTGGGLRIEGDGIQAVVSDSTFRANSAGGDFFNGGAGLCVWFGQEHVTIRACLFENNVMPRGVGAGVFIGPNGTNTIEDCTFQGNTALGGAALYDFGGPMTVARCVVQNNTTSGGSEGNVVVHREWDYIPSAVISDCVFRDNLGSGDAGLTVNPALATATITGTRFENNTSTGVYWGSGGATVRYEATASFTDCAFRGNTGSAAGGAWISDRASSTVRTCVFEQNTGATGGLAYQHGGYGLVEDCLITSNTGQFVGGLLLAGRGSQVRRTRIEGNLSAANDGGARIENHESDDPQTFEFDECDLVNNSSTTFGGGLETFGAGVDARFRGCTFTSNTSLNGVAGALIMQARSRAVLDRCEISDNVATSAGSALYVSQGADVVFRDGQITRNTSSAEAAIFVESSGDLASGLLLEHTDITDNVSASLAAVNVRFPGSMLTLRGCAVERNLANDRCSGVNAELGAALAVDSCRFADNVTVTGQGAVNVNSGSTATITSTDFVRNTAATVGVLRVANVGSSVTMDRCRMLGNSAQAWVGAIHAEDGALGTITNSLIASNSAAREAAVAAWGNGARLDFINCDIVRNTGIAAVWADLSGIVNVRNSIVRSNTINIGAGSGVVNVTHSDVQGGWPGVGNITADPLFADPDGPDNQFGTLDDDYSLGAGSPCVDAGNNAMIPPGILLDLAGQDRRLDDTSVPDTGAGSAPIVDMGAYEHRGDACLADFNHDGTADFFDYLDFVAAFDSEADDADFNHDDSVDFFDYLDFVAAFDAGCD